MKLLQSLLLFSLCALVILLPSSGYALEKGTARLTNVTAVDGGCLSGPNGATTEAWDIQPGYTYTVTLVDVTECANGGTDPTLHVRVNSSIPGHEYTDIVATYVSPGVYEFDFALPAEAWCTLPVLYCSTPGEWLTSGLFVRRHDGATNNNGKPYTSHLRASEWLPGCTNPAMIPGPECGAVPIQESTWSAIKALYQN